MHILCILLFCAEFFFFKQKTAYEMRISDWSSDVCSSDLAAAAAQGVHAAARAARPRLEGADPGARLGLCRLRSLERPARQRRRADAGHHRARQQGAAAVARRLGRAACLGLGREPGARLSRTRPPCRGRRSEEHTSELQSLMRISYAVFCLKKK